MKVIDSHVHLYPPDACADPAGWASARGEDHWAQLSTRRRRDGRPVQSFPGVDDLLRAMDAAGVGRAVLLGWYWNRPETCALQNRFFADCIRAHPNRLSACATFHPSAGRDAAIAEVRRAQGEGFIGLGELSPHSQGYPIDDPVFSEVLALAAELRLPVNLHVTDPESRDFPGRVFTLLTDFTAMAQQHPETTFILSHWGGMLPLRDPSVAALKNVFYDTSASPLLYDPTIWTTFITEVDSARILFGSDYPLNLYPKLETEPEMRRILNEARNSGVNPKQLDDIFSKTAASVFQFDASP